MIQRENLRSSLSVGRIILLSVLVLGIVFFFLYDLDRFLTLESMQANKTTLESYKEDHYAVTVVLFILVYLAHTGFFLPAASILSLSGGFLFGIWWGALYVIVGGTLGAMLAFLSARYLFRDAVERRLDHRFDWIKKGVSRNAFYFLVTIRIIPLLPFFVVNLVSGLTRVSVFTYLAATFIGILPATFIFVNAGSQLGGIQSLKEVASPAVLGALALLALLAVIPVFLRKWTKSLIGSMVSTREEEPFVANDD